MSSCEVQWNTYTDWKCLTVNSMGKFHWQKTMKCVLKLFFYFKRFGTIFIDFCFYVELDLDYVVVVTDNARMYCDRFGFTSTNNNDGPCKKVRNVRWLTIELICLTHLHLLLHWSYRECFDQQRSRKSVCHHNLWENVQEGKYPEPRNIFSNQNNTDYWHNPFNRSTSFNTQLHISLCFKWPPIKK